MKRNLLARIAVFASLLVYGNAFAQSGPDTAPAQDAPAANSIKLVGVIAALPVGAPWLTLGHGLTFCSNRITKTWAGGRVPQELSPYADAFKMELERSGYKIITPGEDNLFDQDGKA